MMSIFQQIWNFTEYAFNIQFQFDNFSFTLWQVILFQIVGFVLILFIREILLFYRNVRGE